VMRIVMVAALLVAVIVLARPCGDAIESFFQSFDQAPPDAAVKEAPRAPEPDPYEGRYHEIKPGMTEKEIEEVIERARREAGSEGR